MQRTMAPHGEATGRGEACGRRGRCAAGSWLSSWEDELGVARASRVLGKAKIFIF